MQSVEHGSKHIRFIVILFALHNRGQAFETHASIDTDDGQVLELSLIVAVVLHKDQVPDLEPAVLTEVVVLGVPENLCAGSAGSRSLAHSPEVVLFVASNDPVLWDSFLVLPQIITLLIRRQDSIMLKSKMGLMSLLISKV